MKKILLTTSYKKMLADLYTPVGIYLRLRDKFRDTILLESTDFHVSENSFSIIGINAIAGIEITDRTLMEFKLPGQQPEKIKLDSNKNLAEALQEFMNRFEVTDAAVKPVNIAQGLFGYTAYDAIPFFESIKFDNSKQAEDAENIDRKSVV